MINTATVAKCPKSTTAVSWNKQGPSGISKAWYAWNPSQYWDVPKTGEDAVDYVDVPAGHYIVNGTTTSEATHGDTLQCHINAGAYYSPPAPSGTEMVVTDQVYLTQPGRIALNCSSTTGTDYTDDAVGPSSLSVIKVNTLQFSEISSGT